jgi:hypothetical protein
VHVQGVLDKDLRLFSDAFFGLIDVDNDGKKIIGFDRATFLLWKQGTLVQS